MDALAKEKELLADASAKEKEQLEEIHKLGKCISRPYRKRYRKDCQKKKKWKGFPGTVIKCRREIIFRRTTENYSKQHEDRDNHLMPDSVQKRHLSHERYVISRPAEIYDGIK